MNKPVLLSADSTCDLSPDLISRYHVKIAPLSITLGDSTFPDTPDFTPAKMYERFRQDGTLPKTAAVSYSDFLEYFRAFTDAGYEVVHLDISADLSATYSNAKLAAEELEGVYVVDSRMLSTGVGLLVIEGAECAAKGMSASDIAARLTSLTTKVDTSFVLDTLEFMWKGGRCSGVAALGANLLKLKPALEMRDGKLVVCKKYRGKMENVYKTYVCDRLAGKQIRPGHIFITHSGEVSDSTLEELTRLIHNTVDVKEVHITVAGCTVSSHCGPGTLGVLFINQ